MHPTKIAANIRSRRVAALALLALAGTVSTSSVASASPSAFALIQSDLTELGGISADGSTVVGALGIESGFQFTFRPFRWSYETGLSLLTPIPSSGQTVAQAISSNGSVIAGRNPSGGFIWNTPGPMQNFAFGEILDLSANGSIYITDDGRGTFPNPPAALPTLPEASIGRPVALSGDGQTVAGNDTVQVEDPGGGGYGYGGPSLINVSRAVRITPSNVVQPLGLLGGDESFALGISSDGAVVVGFAERAPASGGTNRAFSSTGGAPMIELPTPAGTEDAPSEARDASGDGSVIVGAVDGRAVFWSGGEPQFIREYMLSRGIDLSAHEFLTAEGVSDDGRFVVGQSFRTGTGTVDAYRIDLQAFCFAPSPAPIFAPTFSLHEVGQPMPGIAGETILGLSNADLATGGASATLAQSTGDRAIGGPLGAPTAYAGAPRMVAAFADTQGRVVVSGGVLVSVPNPNPFEPPLLALRGQIDRFSPGLSEPLVREGDAAPGTGGGTMNTTDIDLKAMVNNAGDVAFTTRVSGGTSGLALFVRSASGTSRAFFSAPAITNLESLQSPTVHAFSDTGVIARSGTVLVTGGVPIGQGFFVGGPSTHTLRLRTGAPAPDALPGSVLSDIETTRVRQLPSGLTTVRATIQNPDSTSRRVIYSMDPAPDAQARIVLSAGDGITGLGGVTISDIGEYTLRANNTAIVQVYLSGPGINSDNDIALVSVDLAAAQPASMITQRGTLTPGAAPCQWYSLEVTHLSSAGEWTILHTTSISRSVTVPIVLAINQDGFVQPLVRAGQSLNLGGGPSVFIRSFSPATIERGTTGGDGRRSDIASTGQYLLRAQVSDTESGPQSSALLRIDLPVTPGSIACSVADIANTDGDPGADGAIDNGDFQLFFIAFFADVSDPLHLLADIANTDGDPGADGVVDNGDFSTFFNFFFIGCGS
jgi:uncharacterized membrane protein